MTWMLFLLLGTASADPPLADVNQAVNQALLFSKKGWHDEARIELQEVIETEEGRASFEVHALMAQVSLDLQQAEEAKRLAQLAGDLALTPAQSDAMAQLVTYVDRTFGVIVVVGPYKGMTAPLRMETVKDLLDPGLKTWISQLQEQVAERAVLPTRLSVPGGEYLINGQPVTVEVGSTSTLQLSMRAINEHGLAGLQVSRLEFSLGSAMVFSDRLQNLRPSLDIQLGVLQPVGKWILGAHTSWSARSYTVVGARSFTNPNTFMLGATVAREWLMGPLAIRPGLGYGFGLLPGVALACNEITGKEPTQFYCVNPTSLGPEEPVDLYVYAIGRVHMPILEFAVETQHAWDTTAIGLGLKLAIEPLFGRVPSPATANISGESIPLEYVTDKIGFQGVNTRILAQTVFAF